MQTGIDTLDICQVRVVEKYYFTLTTTSRAICTYLKGRYVRQNSKKHDLSKQMKFCQRIFHYCCFVELVLLFCTKVKKNYSIIPKIISFSKSIV